MPALWGVAALVAMSMAGCGSPESPWSPGPPSESRPVTGHHGEWSGDGDVVGPTVVAYPDAVAGDLVGEVRTTVTCTEDSAGGATVGQITPAEVVAIRDADADPLDAWCMEPDEQVHVCHPVLADQDLLSNIWVASDELPDTQKALGVLTSLAAARIEAQIRV